MDHSALHELEDLLQSYESQKSSKPLSSHMKSPRHKHNSREQQRQSMESDIQELLDIVRTKLDTPNAPNQSAPLSRAPPSKDSEKTFWNDMLEVLSNNGNESTSNRHHPQSMISSKSKAKSTGNLLMDTTDQESDSTEDVILNTPLLNTKDTDTVSTANLLHHSQSAVHINSDLLTDRDVSNLENRPFAENIDYKRMEQRVQSKVDELSNTKDELMAKQDHCSKKRIKKLQKVAKQYLDKNGCRMRNDVRQEFLQDFRDSVDQIRAKIRTEYTNKIGNLTHDFQQDLNSELESYRNELKYQYKQNMEDIKGRMLSERAQKMKHIRDKHDKSNSDMLQKLQNELELENEARLSQLQNIMEKERESQFKNLKSRLQNTFQCRYKDLRDELTRNKQNECKMIETTMKSDYERRCDDLKRDTADKLDRFKVDLKNEYAQKTVEMKLKMTATYDSECKLIREKLFAKNQKLRDDIKQKMDMIHQAKIKEIERESDALTFRMTEENKVNLETQQRELQQLKVEKVNLIKEHCFKEFQKMHEANKVNAESDFQKEKLSVMESMDKEFREKTTTDIDAMRTEFEAKHKSVLAAYREKLEIALKADVSKEKQKLKQKQKESMDKLEAKFKKQKKRWMDKINGAAVIDKKNALKKLHSKLQREKNKSIEEMCAKIQQEKQEAIDEMKRQHEVKKRMKFEEIRSQYIADPAMQDDIKMLDLRNSMEEEIDLMDRFSMFTQRIKSLQNQIRMMNQPIPSSRKRMDINVKDTVNSTPRRSYIMPNTASESGLMQMS